MSLRRAFVVLVTMFGVGAALMSPGTAAAKPPERGYYLSLGDSLAFGYQPDLADAGDFDPAHYRGYAEDYAAMRPRLTLVNYGCPGETSTTMLYGGCAWPTSHDPYGSAATQLAAAEAFLAGHPGNVSLISIALGSNDLLGVVGFCQLQLDANACIAEKLPAALQTLSTNYSVLLERLRSLAPAARIVLFNYYNPLTEEVPGSDALAETASEVVDRVAAEFDASVADAFRAINHAAGSPAERAFLCTRTWICTTYEDVHPTDLGYRMLSIALLRAAH